MEASVVGSSGAEYLHIACAAPVVNRHHFDLVTVHPRRRTSRTRDFVDAVRSARSTSSDGLTSDDAGAVTFFETGPAACSASCSTVWS